jgi:hypothetical protein
VRLRQQLYGWHDPAKGYLVSQYPPDAPVRPAIVLETLSEVTAMVDRRKAKILWWPPLPESRNSAGLVE